MKKILVLLLSGAIFLCACSPKGDHSSPSSTPKPSKQSQASSDSIEQDEKAYASTLDSLKKDTSEGRANLYAFYDIDGNGTKELLTGYDFKGQNYLAAIYYLKQGVSTYLAQSRVASAGGSREVTTIYTDGTVFYAQWHSLSPDAKGYLYQLKSDNSGVEVLKEADFQIAGVDPNSESGQHTVFGTGSKKELDLSSLKWKDIENYQATTSVGNQKKQSGSSQLDLEAIQKGDYSSIEGRWRNGKGSELVFDKNGLVNNDLKLGNNFRMIDSYLQGGVSSGGPGAAILFIPAGVDMSVTADDQTIADASDKKQDRILITQSVVVNNPEVFYYRE